MHSHYDVVGSCSRDVDRTQRDHVECPNGTGNVPKGHQARRGSLPHHHQDTRWDTWNRSIVSIARAQAVEQVLDSTYKPALPDEALLFEEKRKFMYAVFERTLQSKKGKAIVRAHEARFDAQKVYAKIHTYCVKSTKALLNSHTLRPPDWATRH
jgi:hypothetical protein